MRAKRIQIKPAKKLLNEFADTYERIAEGRPVKKSAGTFFASINAVRKVLTENRIQLMKVIKQKKPASLYELAKLTHRDLKNVSQDVVFLSELGLVELKKPHGTRSRRRPVLAFD